MASTLKICEIFHSIQGESTRAGRPCAFVRLAGCNLRCAWCDTAYALEGGRELDVDMVALAAGAYRTPLVEITGGEPLFQPAAAELAARLLRDGHEVLVETNGSLDISVLPYPVARIMDLKTPSSGMCARNLMGNLAHLRRGDEVKFVIVDRMDYEWARAMVNDADYPRRVVTSLFSPAQERLAPAELAAWILADGLDVRLNLQLHRVLWPDTARGV